MIKIANYKNHFYHTDAQKARIQRKCREKHNIEEVIDHSMELLVTGVTKIVERIYVITYIRPGWYKLFPQLVISFSFITSLDFTRSRDHPSKELGPG